MLGSYSYGEGSRFWVGCTGWVALPVGGLVAALLVARQPSEGG